MPRRLLAILAFVSFLLFAATCVRWLTGAHPTEHWIFVRDVPITSGIAHGGSVQHNWDLTLTRAAAIRWEVKDWTRWRYHQLTLPYWVAAMLFGALPLFWGMQKWKEQRNRDGHCRHCGYDLRATPDRCPECGQGSAL